MKNLASGEVDETPSNTTTILLKFFIFSYNKMRNVKKQGRQGEFQNESSIRFKLQA